MTVLVEGEKSFIIGAQAHLIEDDREVANSWAKQYITPNPALRWILGKYVEADRANNNKQYWTLGDLRMAQPTVAHAPLNVLHRPRHIVGAFTNTEMIYPTQAEEAAGDDVPRPYIEALAAFWKYYFPEELAVVEMAHNQGALFFSMECVSETVTCAGDGGCGQEFAFEGPRSPSYCEHLNRRSSVVQLNKPHFLAGALIVPPAAPGWSGASVKEIAEIYKGQDDLLHGIYEQLKAETSHLSPAEWEAMMLQLVQQANESKAPAQKRSPRQIADEVVAEWTKKSQKKIRR